MDAEKNIVQLCISGKIWGKSGGTVTDVPVRTVEKVASMYSTKFTMDTYPTDSYNPSEKYESRSIKKVELTSDNAAPNLLYFEINNDSGDKWTHIKKCRFLPLRKDESVIEELSYDLITDGCVTDDAEDFVRKRV